MSNADVLKRLDVIERKLNEVIESLANMSANLTTASSRVDYLAAVSTESSKSSKSAAAKGVSLSNVLSFFRSKYASEPTAFDSLLTDKEAFLKKANLLSSPASEQAAAIYKHYFPTTSKGESADVKARRDKLRKIFDAAKNGTSAPDEVDGDDIEPIVPDDSKASKSSSKKSTAKPKAPAKSKSKNSKSKESSSEDETDGATSDASDASEKSEASAASDASDDESSSESSEEEESPKKKKGKGGKKATSDDEMPTPVKARRR